MFLPESKYKLQRSLLSVCFAVFLINDLYGFVSWRRMQARQAAADA